MTTDIEQLTARLADALCSFVIRMEDIERLRQNAILSGVRLPRCKAALAYARACLADWDEYQSNKNLPDANQKE